MVGWGVSTGSEHAPEAASMPEMATFGPIAAQYRGPKLRPGGFFNSLPHYTTPG